MVLRWILSYSRSIYSRCLVHTWFQLVRVFLSPLLIFTNMSIVTGLFLLTICSSWWLIGYAFFALYMEVFQPLFTSWRFTLELYKQAEQCTPPTHEQRRYFAYPKHFLIFSCVMLTSTFTFELFGSNGCQCPLDDFSDRASRFVAPFMQIFTPPTPLELFPTAAAITTAPILKPTNPFASPPITSSFLTRRRRHKLDSNVILIRRSLKIDRQREHRRLAKLGVKRQNFSNISAFPDPSPVSEGGSSGPIPAFYNPFIDLMALTSFDAVDSGIAAVDNCAGCCVTPHREDFVFGDFAPLSSDASSSLNGVGGTTPVLGKGTVLWSFDDDEGTSHSFTLTAYLVPSCPLRLLRPQTLANDLFPDSADYGTSVQTFGTHTILEWDDRRYKTILLHESTRGIPLLHLHPTLRCSSSETDSLAAYVSLYSTLSAFTSIITSLPDCGTDTGPHLLNSDDSLSDSEPFITSVKPGTLTSHQAVAQFGAFSQSNPSPGHSVSSIEGVCTMEDVMPLLTTPKLSSNSASVSDPDAAKRTELVQGAVLALNKDTLSLSQRTLLRLHETFGHMPFPLLRTLIKSGAIPSDSPSIAHCDVPKCLSCLVGQAKRRPWRSRKEPKVIRGTAKDFHPLTGHLQKSTTASCDHFACSQPGLIPQGKGILTLDNYVGGTVYVDHATSVTYLYLQTSLDAIQTLQGKLAFERFMASHGVLVAAYRADNGIFADHVFRGSILDADQDITYCGVGAHHQNGVAERRIQSISDRARTLLLHAKLRWPEAIHTCHWSLALRYANYVLNHTPDKSSSLSPLQKLAGIDVVDAAGTFCSLHTFGCPVVVLDKRLQTSAKLPRWNERAHVGVFMGFSDHHAANVPLILDLQTGHVSPQFHVVFDDDFTLVPTLRDTSIIPSNWFDLYTRNRVNYLDTSDSDSMRVPLLAWDGALVSEEFSGAASFGNQALPPGPIPVVLDPSTPHARFSSPVITEPTISSTPLLPASSLPPSALPSNVSRYGRLRKPSVRAQESWQPLALLGLYTLSMDPWVALQANFELCSEHILTTLDTIHPFAFVAKSDAADVLTYKQAMNQHDKADFIVAMQKELEDHQSRGHWELISRDNVPRGNKVIPAIWSMCRKRFVDGSLKKHKARLCAGGHRQEYGVNFFDTYSPVVQWMTVRLMLVLALIDGLYTRQIDFVLAFPQAECDQEIFMAIPLGLRPTGHCSNDSTRYCLRLIKNLYGTKQGSYLWFEKLKDTLVSSLTFIQSDVDPCVFYRHGLVLFVYVDDCIGLCRRRSSLDTLVADLSSIFILTDEGDINEYLGLKIHRDLQRGTFTLTQPGLIKRIIDAVGLTDSATKADTPAVARVMLHHDRDGAPREQDWSYRSVIGMLNFLCGSSRPELAFAVHQCARFSQDPKASHEHAVLRIVQYLKCTQHMGLIMTPTSTRSVDCYCDSDFAGSWSHADSLDPTSFLSRSGFVIMFAGCPIIWSSKLQTEITLSTTEAEFVSLSTSLRQVIPLIALLEELRRVLSSAYLKPNIHCTVFEDNSGALEMARVPKMRPRTKHLGLKLHHFREHVRRGTIIPVAIETNEQPADIFTKPLPRDQFQYLRRKVCGW